MRRMAFVACLGAVNLALAVMLVLGASRRASQADGVSSPVRSPEPPLAISASRDTTVPDRDAPAETPSTPFAAIYSADPATLAGNLRRVGCPEQTVKDIILAEANRRYRPQEELLRPTPADHVPYGWSPRTSEAKLLERRQKAVLLGREKAQLLRNALRYEVPINLPAYALMASDQEFEGTLARLRPEQQVIARQAHESYWIEVERLRARTQNFWEPADVAELERLKTDRRRVLDSLEEEAR